MKKRVLSMLLAVLLLAALVPQRASAAGEKLIAITFDDGPSQYTSTLLDGLAARGVKVTFFMQGVNAANYKSIVKRAWQEGHQICSHTYNHPSLTSLSSGEVASQLSRTDSILDGAIGFDLTYMLRPPYGNYNQNVLNIANVPCFYWSVDTEDWRSRNADSVYSMILRYAKDGSVVLLHDLYSTSVNGALRAIDTLKSQGYQFVTVAELFTRRGVTLQNAHIYYNAYPGSAGTASALSAPQIQESASPSGGLSVSITGDSRGTVYYTTNGETPTPANSTRYTGAFTVKQSCTVKAVTVVYWNGFRSEVASKTVDYLPAAAPELKLSGEQVTMTSTTPGAEIRYTTNSKTPDASGKLYTGPITIAKGTTVKAVALAKGYQPSTVSMLTFTENGNLMKDVGVKDWYYAALDRALTNGIITGTSPGMMRPNMTLNRAMLVTMLYRMAAPSESAPDVKFTDVDANGWYYPALCWATDQGIVKGMTDNTFRPNKDISRAEISAMLARYLRVQGYTLPENVRVLKDFADGDAVPKWAQQDVAALVSLGIITGDNHHRINAASGATRAEAVTMLMRALDLPAPEPPEEEAPAESEPAEETTEESEPTEEVSAEEIAPADES